MKVALVAEWLDAWRGGAETSTLQFMHHLMDDGVELHIFTRSRPSPTPGLHVHTITGAAMTRTRRSVTFARRVQRLLREDTFDVVHAISPCMDADVYQPRGGTVAETIRRNVAIRRTMTGRSLKRCTSRLNFKQRYMLAMERRLLAPDEGPIVVAISDYVVRQLKEHYDLPDGRIHKVYNGVDPDSASDEERAANRAALRREFDIGDDELAVLLVAHNFRLKGVRWWMEALSRLCRESERRVRSLVVGRGDTRRWHHLAGRLGVEKVLTFTGPSNRVPAFRHAVDVLVHPTYYDPCSRVVLEGLAAGLPCITTRWDGAAEVIEDGFSGFVLQDPDDVDVLVDRIKRLGDAELRRRMGQAARRTAEQASMARHTGGIIELYESLIPAGA
jgi:UDP-glucose:(heptosyl)LPS alpha-1,3-glucosyltransferase